jgi:hypothetical protein
MKCEANASKTKTGKLQRSTVGDKYRPYKYDHSNTRAMSKGAMIMYEGERKSLNRMFGVLSWNKLNQRRVCWIAVIKDEHKLESFSGKKRSRGAIDCHIQPGDQKELKDRKSKDKKTD